MGQTRIVPIETSGLSFAQAMAKAQAIVDESARDVVQVTGTLDSARYNGALKARDRVFLRGAGTTFDGEYKVSEVRHQHQARRITSRASCSPAASSGPSCPW